MIVLATRATWGFSNPNDAAAFFILAGIALIAIFLLSISGSLRAVLSLIVAGAVLLVILTTESRGALLALMAALLGAGIAAHFSSNTGKKEKESRLFRGKNLNSKTRSLVALTFITFFFATVLVIAISPMGERLLHALSGEDRSVTGRVPVYASIPAMIASAPGGWGTGNAAAAWHNWFEPIGGTENYRHLLSSHATWLVEFSFIGRIFYLAAWTYFFQAALSTPGGVSFVIAALTLGAFNHVFANPTVFAVLLVGAGLIIFRYKFTLAAKENWRKKVTRDAGLAIIAGICLSLGLTTAGFAAQRELAVSKQGDWIQIGNPDDPAILVPSIDEAVVGNRFGHAMRDAAAGGASFLVRVGPSSQALSTDLEVEHCLLLGDYRLSDLPLEHGNISWLNPPAKTGPGALTAMESLRQSSPNSEIEIQWGTWRRDAPARPWREAAAAVSPPATFLLLEATGLFVGKPFFNYP